MTVSTSSLNRKIPFGVKVGYGVGSITACVFFAFVGTYGMYYFTDILGIAPGIAGIIFAIGVLWDAITDPLIGSFSDNLKSKWGRRRPILIACSIPFIFACWLFATPFDFSPIISYIFYTIVLIIYYTLVTMSDVPYSALGAEMTSDYNERISLNTSRSFFGQIGIAVSSIFTLVIIDYFTEVFSSVQLGWSLTGLVFGIVGGLAMIICWRATRGWDTYKVAEEDKMHRNPIEVWKEVLKNRTFRYTALLFAVATIQMTLYGTLSTYYFFDVIGLDEAMIGFTWSIFSVGQFASMPITDFVAKKTSKIYAWVLINGICATVMCVLYLFVIQPGTFMALYIATFALGFATNTIWQIAWAIIPDCVEVEEIVTGKRKEGMYYSITSFVQKVGNAVVLLLAGGLLTIIGYNPEIPVQTPETLTGLKLCISIGVPLVSLLTIIIALKYPLTRQRYEDLLKAIELKRAGKDYDKTVIEKLY